MGILCNACQFNSVPKDLTTWRCDKDGGGVDCTHMTIEGGQVESLSSEVNRGDGERGTVQLSCQRQRCWR